MNAEALEETARRIEGWLLDSDIQIGSGPHRGGIAGWLDADGRPDFVYPEITGYYLTAAAWLASGGASDPERAGRALARGKGALGWLAAATANGAIPPTRLYLALDPGDWRNSGIFTFDLAMAARGAACFAAVSGDADGEAVVRDLVARLHDVCGATVPMPSHAQVGATAPPARWSTEPGVHHLKAAAAILRLPAGVVGESLARVCRGTVAHWTAALVETAPVGGLHPLLYGLEGLLLLPGDGRLDVVASVYERIAAAALAEGRADVLAQALRVGALLRAERGLDALADALVGHVRADGAVAFAAGHERANAWCAMFAQQALTFFVRGDSGAADFLV